MRGLGICNSIQMIALLWKTIPLHTTQKDSHHRMTVPRAPVPPQLKLQALEAELKEDVQLLQERGLTACERHVLVEVFKGLGRTKCLSVFVVQHSFKAQR